MNPFAHILWQAWYVNNVPLLKSVYSCKRVVSPQVEPQSIDEIFEFIMTKFFEYGC